MALLKNIERKQLKFRQSFLKLLDKKLAGTKDLPV